MADPRPSTDQESAPLLRSSDGDTIPSQSEHSGFLDRVNALTHEPITPLSRLLLFSSLSLLLLSSAFVGLYAGAQHRLNSRPQPGDTPPSTTTTTITQTSTQHATTTVTTTASPAPVPTPDPREQACLSPQCIVLSASILSSLDTTHDPCDSFYDYANGGWLAAHPLPADKSSYGNFEALFQQNQRTIQSILEAPIPAAADPADTQILQKLKDFYNSCLDEKTLDKLGMEPLLNVAKTVRGLLKGHTKIEDGTEQVMLAPDTDKVKGLTAALGYLHSRGIGALFAFDIDGDVGVDPNAMTLWFSQPSLGLPSKEYYDEKEITSVYTSVISRLLYLLDEEDDKKSADSDTWPPWPWPPWGGDDDDKPLNKTAKAQKLAKEVLKFETELARAGADLDVLYQDPIATYNPVPFKNLTNTLTAVRFHEYLAVFAPRAFPSRLIITYPPFVKRLNELLLDTSSNVTEAYLLIRVALTLAPNLGMSTEAWKAVRTLEEELKGLKKGAVGDRAEWCIARVDEYLGFAAGRYFVQKVFGGESRSKATRVITDIVKAFKASLPNLKWMDKKSADAASEKASAIRVKVGYPLSPNTDSALAIARYYALVKVQPKTFMSNILSATVNEEVKKWQKLGKRRDPEAWEMTPATVNAYFNPPANEIVFPAGILQPPFFEQDWPSYLAYGSFGMVAAHELTHAFDSAGRLYNQHGKLEQWWTNSTSEHFEVLRNCISKQYSAYTIDDGKGGRIHVNGNLTSGENIGDSGLIQSYRAWKAQYNESYEAGNEYLLPGLNYTREQLFFISFARTWARNMKPQAAVQRIRTDPHSPSRFRVDGTLSNIPEFAAAFNCPKGSKLNPPVEKQCRLW